MSPGSRVVYAPRPEWGLGIVRLEEPNGRLLVDFKINGQPYSDDFHPAELKPAEPATAA